ncbi:DUF1015 domain-containing protein [bacterium]|nr:DUF1015 domain-containing protein [bacterium]
MIEVKPFKGILYNSEKISNFSQVMAPPYDVISKQDQERYIKSHPCNIAHLDKGLDLPNDTPEYNKYTRASNYLNNWLEEGYLTLDQRPSFYAYQKIYNIDNIPKILAGFIGLLRLEDFSSQRILPHEKTHHKPIEDRLNLLSHCRAHLSPVFSLYQDYHQEIPKIINDFIEKKPPFIDLIFEDCIRHKVWKISDQETMENIQKAMKDKKIFIADGHHRYQTALNYQRQLINQISPDSPENFIMMYFTNILNEGLTILPTHRLISSNLELNSLKDKIKEYFHLEDCFSLLALSQRLREKENSNYIFGLFGEDKFYLLTLKDPQLIDKLSPQDQPWALNHLAVSVLQHIFIQNILHIKEEEVEHKIGYTRSMEEAVKLIKEGRYQLGLFLTPTKIAEVEKISNLGGLMPQKSTYFYPKLLTGLVMYKFN